jgi:hypothetical protein
MNAMTRALLSKSRLTAFMQCPKRLWLEMHKPELRVDSLQAHRHFAVGHTVGALACAAYPEGILIAPDNNLTDALQQTETLIRTGSRRPLFEATFRYQEVLVRVDLLLPTPTGWHMAEVKSTGSAKDYQLEDVATQVWVARGVGVPIVTATIRHLNTQFIYQTADDYRGLFIDTPVDEAIAPRVAQRLAIVEAAKATARGLEPVRAIGEHCDSPVECPFKAYCTPPDAATGPRYPVTVLPGAGGKKLARELQDDGFIDLCEVPAHRIGADRLRRIHSATVAQTPYCNTVALREAISIWPQPHYYLDFETIAFAIPRWLGTRPFEAVVFQFSCHIDRGHRQFDHVEFLDLSGNDPSRACANALVNALGDRGAIITYNASFERSCLRRLAAQCPELAPALTALHDRVVDLLPLVRSHYYHADMRGSYSIKAVLPTVAPELNYGDLEDVQNGEEAQLAYMEAINTETATERRARIEQALRVYCQRDTWAMVVLAQVLRGEPL